MNASLVRIVALLLFLSAGSAHAICIVPPLHVFVGDTASDSMCSYNTIQAAIDAATTNPSCSTIVHVTREHTYTEQHLTISNRNITLAGWGDGVTCAAVASQCDIIGNCPLPTPAINPLILLFGHDGDSVIHIDGASNVSLLNLGITEGSVSDKGGGIYYDGNGSLSLTSTTVNLNHAGYGAGISMNGDGGPANLYLNAYSQILANTADVSGGGIRMTGTSRLFALQPHILIGFNHAPNGNGGGVDVTGPARADIGSPGFNGLAVIYDNDAQYGGGISISGGSDDQQDGAARIFTTDSVNPVQVSNNTASHTGGAIYLKPFNDIIGDESAATFCARDFRMDDNIAQEGAAIYADLDSSPTIGGFNQISHVALNSLSDVAYCSEPESATTLGAVACAQGTSCNTIDGSITEDSQDTSTAGAVILIQTNAEFSADRITMRGNHAAHAIRAFDPLFNYLSNCLIVDNVFSAEVALVENEGTYTEEGSNPVTQFRNCTVSNNAISGSDVFSSARGFKLQDSIIDQPGVPTLNYTDTASNLVVKDVLTNDSGTLPDTVYIQQGGPTFVDAANGNYHLTSASLGVDFAPSDSTTPILDLDGKPRVVDLPSIVNKFGAMDLGAYELQQQFACGASDTIFCDGFESTPQ